MIKIDFYADSDFIDVSEAVVVYQEIWQKDGEQIIEAWERVTGLAFRESFINAIVFSAASRSHPLSLRSDLSEKQKRAALVHELGHRIIFGRRKNVPMDTLENHKGVYLLYYDVLIELYGKEDADAIVQFESGLRSVYKEAWDWALTYTPEERKVKFRELVGA